ncbi:hypothetical protein QDX80_23495, partial [Escherichia coli]
VGVIWQTESGRVYFLPLRKWQVNITLPSSFPVHKLQSMMLRVLFSPSTQIVTMLPSNESYLTWDKIVKGKFKNDTKSD